VKPGDEDDVFHFLNSQPEPSGKGQPDFDMLDYPPAKISSRYSVLTLSRYWEECYCTALPPFA
jgi:hypothetical protein